MDLPPGPRAPAAWQTVAWMARPGSFLRGVHDRFGDPVTIRTYWTSEPMVLFSGPDAVREIFRLDPAIAPAGQSWEFLSSRRARADAGADAGDHPSSCVRSRRRTGGSGLRRCGRQGGPARATGAHDRATPAARAGAHRRALAACRDPGCRLPVARVATERSMARRCRIQAGAVARGPGAEPVVVDPVRGRRAALRRRAVRRDGDARGATRRGRVEDPAGTCRG